MRSEMKSYDQKKEKYNNLISENKRKLYFVELRISNFKYLCNEKWDRFYQIVIHVLNCHLLNNNDDFLSNLKKFVVFFATRAYEYHISQSEKSSLEKVSYFSYILKKNLSRLDVYLTYDGKFNNLVEYFIDESYDDFD